MGEPTLGVAAIAIGPGAAQRMTAVTAKGRREAAEAVAAGRRAAGGFAAGSTTASSGTARARTARAASTTGARA
ncbi:MAG: hypothetical protein EOQ27_02690 [Mesorhizobium sp.]|nr:MAG: hypothetical protein EOQ27_02690 [Mesorhizobium sp.]